MASHTTPVLKSAFRCIHGTLMSGYAVNHMRSTSGAEILRGKDTHYPKAVLSWFERLLRLGAQHEIRLTEPLKRGIRKESVSDLGKRRYKPQVVRTMLGHFFFSSTID